MNGANARALARGERLRKRDGSRWRDELGWIVEHRAQILAADRDRSDRDPVGRFPPSVIAADASGTAARLDCRRKNTSTAQVGGPKAGAG